MSVPPSACGVMWSGSGLSGVLLAVQLMGVRHSGQVRCPACCACLMALRRSVIHLVVPVRLVAIPTPRCTLVPLVWGGFVAAAWWGSGLLLGSGYLLVE